MTQTRRAMRATIASLIGMIAAGGTAFANQAAVAPAQAGAPWHGAPGGHPKHADQLFQMFPILDGVDATPQQRAAVHGIFKKAHEGSDRKFDHLLKQEQDLVAQIMLRLRTPGPVDRAELVALLRQDQSLRAQTEVMSLDEAIAIHDLLTAAQLDQARTTAAQKAAEPDARPNSPASGASKG